MYSSEEALQEKLKEYEWTRTIDLWHDHSSILCTCDNESVLIQLCLRTRWKQKPEYKMYSAYVEEPAMAHAYHNQGDPW